MDDLPPPILDDLFEEAPDGRLLLRASRCGPGGPVVFPRRVGSAHCEASEMEDTVLSPEGEVWSWTVSRMGPPVIVAQVEFDEGPIVQGYLLGDPESPAPIGTAVDVVPFPIPLPGKDEMVTTYAFRPKEVPGA